MSRCTACKRDTAADDALQCAECQRGIGDVVRDLAKLADVYIQGGHADAVGLSRSATDARTLPETAAAQPSQPQGVPVRSEAEIQAEIVAWLRLHGWDVTVTSAHTHAKGVTAGTPDLYCRRPVEGWEGVAGHHYWIEVKRPGGKVSEAQMLWHARERAAGGTVIVAYGIEDVQQLA